MATNRVYEHGVNLVLPVAEGVVSGDPVVVGQIPGVALTDRDSDGNATVQMDGVFDLSVKGVQGAGDVAVAVGDILYHVAADTPDLSKKTTGVRFGYALEAVASGATATIQVKIGY